MTNLISSNQKLYFIRNQYVMLDKDVAEFYSISTRDLNKAVKRGHKGFDNLRFELTLEEYKEVLKIQGLPYRGGHKPFAYTYKGAYKVAFMLQSSTSLKVADVILDYFMERINKNKGIPDLTNQVQLLEKKIEEIDNKLQGVTNSNNFYGPATFVQGSHNQIQIGNSEKLVLDLFKLMSDENVIKNKEVYDLLQIAIEQSSKKDKDSILDTLKKVVETGSGLSSITTAVPAIIEVVKKIIF